MAQEVIRGSSIFVEELSKLEWTLIGLQRGWFPEDTDPRLGSVIDDVLAIREEQGWTECPPKPKAPPMPEVAAHEYCTTTS